MAIIHCGRELKQNLIYKSKRLDFGGIILRMIPQRNHSRDRCLQLRKSLKRKEFGIEKQLIFNKLFAEFLTLNLN